MNPIALILLLIIGGGFLFILSKSVHAETSSFYSKSQIESLIRTSASVYGLEPALVYAIAKVESNLNPLAKNPADPSYGLMQIMPMLAQDYGFVKDWRNPTSFEINSLYDPNISLTIACQHLARLLRSYSMDVAIQMYNVGETGYKRGIRAKSYLEKVRGYYEAYNKT